MYPFKYRRPTSVADAVKLFEAGEDAAFLSGGHTLLPALKARLAAPSDLIDLTALPGLKGIEETEGGILIRGGTVHADVAASPLLRDRIPVLAGLAGSIGDRHVRHRGTIGGSVANNDPAADYPAAVLALNAMVITDRRRIAASEYFTGLYETCREPGEIIVGVAFPVPLSAGYAKFRNLASRYALAAVFVARTEAGIRVAVTGAYNGGVTRVVPFEAALGLDFSAGALDPLSIDPEDMLSDSAASGAYRANLVKVLTRRAVARQGEVQFYK
jgi:aerobic carbon-monoxide dehydrogenase medium subunit